MDEKVSDGHASQLPFVAPCRILPALAPLDWVRHGWRDMWAAPRQSLTYGAIVVALSLALATVSVRLGGYFELLALVSGFILVAPVLAVGTYVISIHLERGALLAFVLLEPIKLRKAQRNNKGFLLALGAEFFNGVAFDAEK